MSKFLTASVLIIMSFILFFDYKNYKLSQKVLKNTAEKALIKNPFDSSFSYMSFLDNSISRSDFISKIDKSKNILEVGPFFSPVLKGKNVKYFDVLNKEGLIKKFNDPEYGETYVDNIENDVKNNIPNIDFVHPKGDMSIIREKFDIVFSSHNIEHQVDLIKHLKQISEVLNKNGKIFLVIPDKRFCFDHYIPESNLSNVIATHEMQAKVHDMQTILAMKCEITHNYSEKHWSGDSEIQKLDVLCYKKALAEFNSSNGNYIDAHKWRFTPQSFYKIVEYLAKMNYIDLEVEHIFKTRKGSLEFYVVLKKKS